jgi:hypothetical protein
MSMDFLRKEIDKPMEVFTLSENESLPILLGVIYVPMN